jgi:putative transposase
MPAPYPVELRDRVVKAWKAGEGSFKEIGARFMVGEASVNRWVSRERRTGSVAPSPMGGARHDYLVDGPGEELLKDLLVEYPDSTLRELCLAYEADRGVAVSPQAMSETLRRLGYTQKKGSFVQNEPSKRNT